MTVMGLTVDQMAVIGILIIIGLFLWSKIGGRGLAIIALIAIITAVWLLVSTMNAFQEMTSQRRIATVHATEVSPHDMSIDLTVYDSNGNKVSENTYPMSGDEWMLQSQVVEVQPLFRFFGVKNGVLLSRLDSEFNDPSTPTAMPVELNSFGGFLWLEDHVQMFSLVMHSAYGNAVIEPIGTYSVFVDQFGDLSANRAA